MDILFQKIYFKTIPKNNFNQKAMRIKNYSIFLSPTSKANQFNNILSKTSP